MPGLLLLLALLLMSQGSSTASGSQRLFAGLRDRVARDPHKIVVSFKEDLESLLASGIDESDLQLLHGRYMANLRETYFRKFLSLLGKGRPVEDVAAETLKECRATMMLSTPESGGGSWSFEGYLSELEADMGRYLEEVASSELLPSEGSGGRPTWRTRLRGLASQALLLLVNLLQSEWHRRATRRAAEKRLAEVPEFPLL